MSEKQSKVDSWMEVATSTAIGFSVAMVGNHIILPITYGVKTSASANFWTAVGFTILSMARQYVIRRAFNGRSVWQAIKGRFA